MVLDRIENHRQHDGSECDSQQATVQHRAQPNAQHDKKRAIENHEEIIEAEIEPQAEGNKGRCQIRTIGFNGTRRLEKILRTARGQDRHHHGGNRQGGERGQDGEHTIQRPVLHDIPLLRQIGFVDYKYHLISKKQL